MALHVEPLALLHEMQEIGWAGPSAGEGALGAGEGVFCGALGAGERALAWCEILGMSCANKSWTFVICIGRSALVRG